MVEHIFSRSERTARSRTWDVVIAVVATAAAISTPAVLALDLPVQGGVVFGEWTITAFLLADVVVRYRRSRHSGDLAVSGSRASRAAGLVADLLAAAPVVLITGTATPWQLLRLLKLVRVGQLMHEWRHRALQHAGWLRLVFFSYWTALVTHWIACGWLAMQTDGGSGSAWSQYLDALYWCITTMSGVGYGDITPETQGQKVFAIGVMVLGLGIFGFVIGNIATILVNLDPARTAHLRRLEQLVAFMDYRGVPARLRDRSVEYYRYLWQKGLDYDESEVLHRLPPSLRTDVAMFLNRDLIKRVPMFDQASEAFVREAALELKPIVLLPGDYAVRAGDTAHSMYFVSRGLLEAVSADGETVLRTLSPGDYFGEIGLLTGEPRTASVRAVEYCDIYELDKQLFERLLQHHPEIADEIRSEAKERRSRG